ncbi:MAG: DUF2029 domain-containing protein [Nitrospinae bacterium]|nr:DUF2029 domain-containing protein [Nitrospinota bacterium]
MRLGDHPFKRKADFCFLLFFILLSISPLMHAPHNNYTAFNNGALDIVSGRDPYPQDWQTSENFRNWFMYSPSFGVFFMPFSKSGLGLHMGTLAWYLLNLFAFWYGFKGVVRHLDPTGLFSRWWHFLALLLCANEMMGSLTNLQSNAFIGGLMMAGMAAYFEKRYVVSALLLALGTNFKIYPVVAALLMAMELNAAFLLSFAVFFSLILLAPAPLVGMDFLFSLLAHWLGIFMSDPLHPVFLGLEPTLAHFGLHPGIPQFLAFISINALAIAIVAFAVFQRERSQFIRLLAPLALAFILLFNKRTESPTFVLLVPALAFILHEALYERHNGDDALFRAHLAVMVAAWFLISLAHSDLFPKMVRHIADEWRFKTFGALLVYCWAWVQAVQFFFGTRRDAIVVPLEPA